MDDKEQEPNKLEESGLLFERVQNEKWDSKFDLALLILDKGSYISLNFQYDSKLFKKDSIEKFANYFEDILETILIDENTEIGKINITHGLASVKAPVLDIQLNF